jgi:hypothetical protein
MRAATQEIVETAKSAKDSTVTDQKRDTSLDTISDNAESDELAPLSGEEASAYDPRISKPSMSMILNSNTLTVVLAIFSLEFHLGYVYEQFAISPVDNWQRIQQ